MEKPTVEILRTVEEVPQIRIVGTLHAVDGSGIMRLGTGYGPDLREQVAAFQHLVDELCATPARVALLRAMTAALALERPTRKPTLPGLGRP